MRIILCLNNDIMSNIALNLLRDELVKHEVRIFLSQHVGDIKKAVDEISLLEKHIPCNIIFPLLEKHGKPENGKFYTFRQVELYDNISISTPKNINHPDIIEGIA